jgi:hypothetical protein
MGNSIILETLTKQKHRKECFHLVSMRVIDAFSGTIPRCCFRQQKNAFSFFHISGIDPQQTNGKRNKI